MLFADFVIRSQDQSPKLPLCRSFSSREDLSMYHVTKFVQKETVNGAACSIIDHSDGDDSDKDDNDDIVISGSTVELKVSPREAHKWQLLACMEKLSAELALKAVRSKNIFSQIIIYGMLVDCKSGDTEVGKLTMDFLSHESTLTWCRESVGMFIESEEDIGELKMHSIYDDHVLMRTKDAFYDNPVLMIAHFVSCNFLICTASTTTAVCRTAVTCSSPPSTSYS